MAGLSHSIPRVAPRGAENLATQEESTGKQLVLPPGRIEFVAVCMPHWYYLRNRAGCLDLLLSLYLKSWLCRGKAIAHVKCRRLA